MTLDCVGTILVMATEVESDFNGAFSVLQLGYGGFDGGRVKASLSIGGSRSDLRTITFSGGQFRFNSEIAL